MMLLEVSNTQGKKGFYLNLKKLDIERFGRGKYQVSDQNRDDFLKLAARYDITVTKKEVTPIIEDTNLLSRITTLEHQVSELSERIAALDSAASTGPIVIEVPETMSWEEFEQSLVRNYLDLRGKSAVAPRVLIADLRDAICGELGISENIFDKELLARNEQDPYRYQLGYGQIKGKKGIPGRKGTFAFFLMPEKEFRKSGDLSEPQQLEISDEEFWDYVKQAYWNVPRHTRQIAVEIPKVRKLLSEYTGLPRDEIDKRLYRLFIQHKIDLQPGGSDDPSDQLVSDTGYTFYWFKLREEEKKKEKKEKKRERTIEDRTGEWLQMTQSGIQYELEGYTVAQMKQAAARILKTGDRRIKNKQKMIDRILKRMKEYRSRFEYGITSEEVIKQEYGILNKEYPALGGVIEIPALWERVQSRISIDRDTFDNILKSLAEQEIIDLKFAMDTLIVKEPEQGIHHPKGLIYYVLWREPKKETQLDKIKRAFYDKPTEEILKQAYERVRQNEPRFSALIPLNYLKKELKGLDEEEINQKLLELEKKRIIDLQVAYDASQVNEPEYGIELPGRGLIYFVRFR